MSELFIGFYFGIISVILLYNLQWYINTKEKSYLYYILMQVSIIILFLQTIDLIEISTILMLTSTICFSFLFIKEFLNLKHYYSKINELISKILIVFLIFSFLLFLLDAEKTFQKIPFFIFFIPFLFIAINVYKKGLDIAKYFILGWGVFVSLLFLSYLMRVLEIDLLDRRYISLIGIILEALILSFSLAEKTKQIISAQKEQEQMLIHQSRLASMGEMLANISHQWRQPLNRIASFIMNMQMHIMDNYEKEKFLLEKLEESQIQLEYMSNTIDDFTNFYKKDKDKEVFNASQAISNAVNIINSSLKSGNVELQIEIKNDFEINAYPKELSQVILNILQNAKDQLILKNISSAYISIISDERKIQIKDNAGGIEESIINKIFDPYFTTKKDIKGTGLGLYMSKIILEKHFNATINVKNIDKGAQFTILFK